MSAMELFSEMCYCVLLLSGFCRVQCGDCVVTAQDGKAFGDEYLAELDLIEVVEKHKEDYESDVEEPGPSCAGSSSISDDDARGDKDSDRFVAVLACI